MSLKRNNKPVNYTANCDNSSSDVECDPFKDSDNEKDEDFQPLPKKKRIASNKLPNPKRLSPKERLDLLNQKFKSDDLLNKRLNAHTSKQIEFASKKNDNNGADNEEKLSSIETGPSFGSYDLHFGPKDTTEISLKTESDFDMIEIAEENQSCEPVNSASYKMFLELNHKLNDINANVTLLRKQLSRVELKSLGIPVVGHSEPNMNIQPEIMLDLDAALTKEGLPIATCVELNQFEAKLRRDTQFKEKMVRFCINLLNFILFMI